MAKMMMGQIDHARTRLRELVSTKVGDEPARPQLQSAKDVLEGLRKGDLSVSPAMLRKAFSAFINQEAVETVDDISNGYPHYGKSYVPATRVPKSVEDALCALFYSESNKKLTEQYKRETEEYLALKAAVVKESKAVEDAIVLGDQHAALIALQDFANFQP